jgi:hypothetical protein
MLGFALCKQQQTKNILSKKEILYSSVLSKFTGTLFFNIVDV